MAPSERAKRLRVGAQRGSAQDQYSLACCYAEGTDGLQENKWMAAQLCGKAADQGHAGAKFGLGVMYERGTGVVRNLELAVSWYTEAAQQGNQQGQFNLGVMYRNGKGVERNLELAVSWYRLSAEQGHLNAQCCLGYCLERGDGVEQDTKVAATIYRKAAISGHARAQGNLADCYACGKGLKRDDALAVEWWEKAAAQGHAMSQRALGVWHMHGERGLSKNVKRAKMLLQPSAKQGDILAIESLKELTGSALELDPGQCAACGAPDITRTCLGCRRVRYCNPACQKRDLKSHRPDCGSLNACLCFSCASDRRGECSTSSAAARGGESSTASAAAI
jgi:TPR repeat protein